MVPGAWAAGRAAVRRGCLVLGLAARAAPRSTVQVQCAGGRSERLCALALAAAAPIPIIIIIA